jgi:hypothetical protein
MIHVRSAPDGLLLAGAAALVLSTAGCSNNVDLGAGIAPSPCPITISFQNDIQTIFTPKCATEGVCHGPLQAAPMSLEADSAYANIVNVLGADPPSMDRVEPFMPDASGLVHKVQGSHTMVGGLGTRMPPPPRQALPQPEIDLIRCWIVQGAENN